MVTYSMKRTNLSRSLVSIKKKETRKENNYGKEIFFLHGILFFLHLSLSLDFCASTYFVFIG